MNNPDENIVQQLVDDESLDDEEMEELEIPPVENNEAGGNQNEDTIDKEQVNQKLPYWKALLRRHGISKSIQRQKT